MEHLRALIKRTTAAVHSNRAEYPPSETRAELPQPRWPIHGASNLGEEDESPPSSPFCPGGTKTELETVPRPAVGVRNPLAGPGVDNFAQFLGAMSALHHDQRFLRTPRKYGTAPSRVRKAPYRGQAIYASAG